MSSVTSRLCNRSWISAVALITLVASCTVDPSLQDGDLPSDDEDEEDRGPAFALGDRGAEVQEVYQRLRRYGYFPNPGLAVAYPGWRPLIPIDPDDIDVLDDAMHEALLLFQHANGLAETGALDRATWTTLRAPRCGVPDYYPPSVLVNEQLAAHDLHAGERHFLHDVDALADAARPQSFVPSVYGTWPHTELRYGFGAATADTSVQFQRQALVAALATWLPHAPLIVTERADPDLLWSFMPKNHGPMDSFDNEFAHNQYPYGCY